MTGGPKSCGAVVKAYDATDLGTPLCPDCYDYAGQVAFNCSVTRSGAGGVRTYHSDLPINSPLAPAANLGTD